jgi:hypothetical protein
VSSVDGGVCAVPHSSSGQITALSNKTAFNRATIPIHIALMNLLIHVFKRSAYNHKGQYFDFFEFFMDFFGGDSSLIISCIFSISVLLLATL